jgi:hypothetical protein
MLATPATVLDTIVRVIETPYLYTAVHLLPAASVALPDCAYPWRRPVMPLPY